MLLNASASLAADDALADFHDLVFVTEDHSGEEAGCDGISIFGLVNNAVNDVFHGPMRSSPGRLAASPDLKMVAAQYNNSFAHLALATYDDVSSKWHNEIISETHIAHLGAPAFLPDGDRILVPFQNVRFGRPLEPPPHPLNMYRLSEISDSSLGPVHATAELDAIPIAIFPIAESNLIHVVTAEAAVYTLDMDTLEERAPKIDIPAVDAGERRNDPSNRLSVAHATISSDASTIFTNRWAAKSVVKVDLTARTSQEIELTNVWLVGGLDISKGTYNRDVLVVNAGTQMIFYRWDTSGPDLQELYRQRIPMSSGPGCAIPDVHHCTGPLASIAWSVQGAYVIVAQSSRGVEFGLYGVREDVEGVQIIGEYEACPLQPSMPNDILTANRHHPHFVTPTPTATPTETSTPTPSPTNTFTASPTPSKTATASPTPTELVYWNYLPLILREECTKEQRRVNIVLVLDASTSMLEQTHAGRTKLDAAREASEQLLGLLALDPAAEQEQRDLAGIVSFNAEAQVLEELSADLAELKMALSRIQPQQQTCIVCGLDAAQKVLAAGPAAPGRVPVILLLTDGRSNPRPVSEALRSAEFAKAAGITVFTIGLGPDHDAEALRQMASQPGFYHHAPSAEDLRAIYEEIAADIPCPSHAFWAKR